MSIKNLHQGTDIHVLFIAINVSTKNQTINHKFDRYNIDKIIYFF